ncbi:universal stress protein [Ramlibacter ginsenosidimutans]|uniref:Universal stress protein n=1 Tax=Ramlibacter ginsenosidimutans TaxID=502333 RepID=A0A934TQL7_9BURK|nr:universal stress protein [Ramlibacter ginsenosidimutans]MBK6005335.1 universal stress protein [Ramlibacter ginsenosidimutans]
MKTSLRQILVHLDATAPAVPRLTAARRIAQQQGASLAALYAVTPMLVQLPYAPEAGPTVAAALLAIEEERRTRVLKAFDAEMTLPGPMATWTQTDDLPTVGAVAQQAFYADLLVLGQHDPADAAAHCVPPDFVESVVIASGRPAVVLPSIGWTRPIGENIAIAWKETPESARALQAAMPFLQRAGRVHVLSWSEEEAPRLGGKGLDLQGYLRVHGVEAVFHHGGKAREELGEILLSRVFDLGCDLLVMGCYGHGRAREWVLGGVSRTLLSSMTLPVLMAH